LIRHFYRLKSKGKFSLNEKINKILRGIKKNHFIEL
jgi:hypothetical protein